MHRSLNQAQKTALRLAMMKLAMIIPPPIRRGTSMARHSIAMLTFLRRT
jgi:hypothetical protein